jgi:DNA invertase Pin-like site-specific DNA recombinase
MVLDVPASGELNPKLMDLSIQYERAVIRARTRAALAVKRSKGQKYTRRARLGFRFEGGRVVEDPAERDTLARVREMKSRGFSLARVAGILNAEGARCRGGPVARHYSRQSPAADRLGWLGRWLEPPRIGSSWSASQRTYVPA